MSKIDFKTLASPFAKDELDWRIMSAGHKRNGEPWAIAVPYLDSRSIQQRLDEVVGPENWQTKYSQVGRGYICDLSLRIEGEWITKEDGSEETDHEPFKGAISRALVRAAVHWGIGRYLYKMPKTFVQFVDFGTPGSTRVEIEGQEYYYMLPGDAPREAASRPTPAPAPAPAPSQAQRATSAIPNVLSAKSASAPGLMAQKPESDPSVPFGPLQGRKLSELNEGELGGLVDWYSRVPNPQGKAKSFKKVLDSFLAAKMGGTATG